MLGFVLVFNDQSMQEWYFKIIKSPHDRILRYRHQRLGIWVNKGIPIDLSENAIDGLIINKISRLGEWHIV